MPECAQAIFCKCGSENVDVDNSMQKLLNRSQSVVAEWFWIIGPHAVRTVVLNCAKLMILRVMQRDKLCWFSFVLRTAALTEIHSHLIKSEYEGRARRAILVTKCVRENLTSAKA